MEFGSIVREFHVDASPEVVFEVISNPAHIREWWTDEAELEPAPGAVGALIWGDKASPDAQIVPITVVDAEPPRMFSFRWVAPAGEAATAANSLLVTFELAAKNAGTLVRFSEVGFREMGWEVAVLEEQYTEHAESWDRFLPRLREYLTRLVSAQ